MSGKTMEFLKAPKENLDTWNLVVKIMTVSAVSIFVVVLLLVLPFALR